MDDSEPPVNAAAWSFDIFALDKDALEGLVEHLFERAGVVDSCGVDRPSLRAFISAARAAHADNAFHNWWHVCDVTHAACVLLCEGGAAQRLPPAERLALLLAALCHDAEHPGTSNGFLARTQDPKVAQYGPASTLERHHAAVAAALLRSPAARGVLGGLGAAQAERVTSLVATLIAATDIERHGAHMAAFAAHWGDDVAEPAAAEDGSVADAAAREAFLTLLLKAADVSNAAKPWPLAARWAGLLKAEHLLLAEREVDAGLPLTPFLTLPIPQLCKGFIEGVAAPMLQQLGRAVPYAAAVALPLACANAAEWARLGASPEAAAAEALGATIPPDRPRIGATALACAAEHSARREADAAAAREAPAGAPTPAPKPVAVL